MYGRHSTNIFAGNNSNSSSYNNNNSNTSYNTSGYNNNGGYSNNNNSYSNYNNNNSNHSNNSYNTNNRGDRIGSYRTNYKPDEIPTYLTSIIDVWKTHPPISVAAREELLQLSPTEIRIEDYILIRNRKLNAAHEGFLKDVVNNGCFNQELLKNNCHNPLPYTRDSPYSMDAIKVMAKRSETGNTYGSSYGTYGNNSSYANTSGNNSSSYNTRSNNNIFNNNSGSGYGNNNNNNNSSSGNNIFSRNSTNNGSSGGNNIFSNNSNSSNNSSGNNMFSSSNNNNNSNSSSTNIFNRNSNTGNNNNYNNNSTGNNNNASNNIFNRNNNGSNIFSNNNNNNSGGNNIFNSNNNNGGSNNIFANNNNNRNNIFNNSSNNNNGNSLFNNNNNNGNNIFNNNNNANNNSLFNNNYNPYNQMDPRFLTELQTYMKNVNEVVRKLNGSFPQSNNPSSVSNEPNSIFSSNEPVKAFEHFDPYQIDSYTKKKRQDQQIFVTAKIEDKSSDNSRNSRPSMSIEEVNRSQILDNSQMGGQRLKNSYINHSKMGGSWIGNNEMMKGSKIISNQSFFKKNQPQHAISASNNSHITNAGRSKLYFNAEPEFEQGSHLRKSRYFHQGSEGPCECIVNMGIVWMDVDLKKCDQLFDKLQIKCSMSNLEPNKPQWKAQLVRQMRQVNPAVRSDAELLINDIWRLEGQNAHFEIVGELQQRLFNIDAKQYQVMFTNVKKGLAYNLCISNQYGGVSWHAPIDVTHLQFAEGGEFSIEDNAIINENECLNARCHVNFVGLPQKIRTIVAQNEGDLEEAKKILGGWVSKKSNGRFQLIDIWIDSQNRGAGWTMDVSKFT